MKGLFISFEGLDGAGKSLQAGLLHNYFIENGVSSLLLREPGATTIGEKIRSIIIDPENTAMSPVAEALLYAAARAQLVREVIAPALSQGRTVICDRFLDSSLAYQGMGRGLSFDTVLSINAQALMDISPDITFYIKLPPEIGLSRKSQIKALDRLENEKLSFHNLVFDGYNKIAEIYGERVRTVDGALPPGEIHKIILNNVNVLLSRYKKEE